MLHSFSLPDFDVGLVEGSVRVCPYPQDTWVGPFVWDEWVMDFSQTRSSQLAVSVGGEPYVQWARPRNSWCIFAPGVTYRHRTNPVVDGDLDFHWFFFRLRGRKLPFCARPFSMVLDPEERIAMHVREMYALQQSGRMGAAMQIHGHALVIFGELLSAPQRGGSGSPADPWRAYNPASVTADRSLLSRVDEAALRRLTTAPSIGDLADALNMSVSSLAHRFKRETGMTVMERVRWLRIREARALLSKPGASVKQAASKLGFSNPLYLSKVFRKLTGMTATTFMQQNQHKPTQAQRQRGAEK
jgi:AraC-like DNA-binding protein